LIVGTLEGEMLKEFRDFILRGNVIDLAVGIVIGAAFGATVTSFVTNVLTPLLGFLYIPNFSKLSFTAGITPVPYGLFLNQLITFVLVAAAIFFFVVKPVNAMTARLKKPESDTEPPIKTCPFCATDIPSPATRCPHCTSDLS
jgi:large conductance mechanosensitive channel